MSVWVVAAALVVVVWLLVGTVVVQVVVRRRRTLWEELSGVGPLAARLLGSEHPSDGRLIVAGLVLAALWPVVAVGEVMRRVRARRRPSR